MGEEGATSLREVVIQRGEEAVGVASLTEEVVVKEGMGSKIEVGVEEGQTEVEEGAALDIKGVVVAGLMVEDIEAEDNGEVDNDDTQQQLIL